MDGSRLRISMVGDVLLASFSGELQGEAALRFEDELAEAERGSATRIVLDLRDVGSVDGTGLALLIDAARRARADQRHMCVLSSPAVYSTFCGTGLLQAFSTIGLLQAVEVVHPCTLDILTDLGWLRDTAEPQAPWGADPPGSADAPPAGEGRPAEPPRRKGPGGPPVPPALGGPEGGATVTPLLPGRRPGRRPRKPR